MSLRDEIKEYRQLDGLVSPDKNPTPDSTGNGTLYTCLYFLCLARNSTLTEEDYDDFYHTINACMVPDYQGLFYRSRTKVFEQDSCDDYIGIVAASQLMNTPFHKWIYLRGVLHRFFCFQWIYNDLQIGQWTWQSWFGRFSPFICALHWSLGLHPSVFRRIVFYSGLSFNSFFKVKETTLGNFLVIGCSKETFCMSLFSDLWEWAIIRAWGTKKENRPFDKAIKLALAQELGENHPIVKRW